MKYWPSGCTLARSIHGFLENGPKTQFAGTQSISHEVRSGAGNASCCISWPCVSGLHPIRVKHASWCISCLWTSGSSVIRHIQGQLGQTYLFSGVKTLDLLVPINNSLQHVRNYLSLGKGLADQRHLCFMDLLRIVIKTSNVTLALTLGSSISSSLHGTLSLWWLVLNVNLLQPRISWEPRNYLDQIG